MQHSGVSCVGSQLGPGISTRGFTGLTSGTLTDDRLEPVGAVLANISGVKATVTFERGCEARTRVCRAESTRMILGAVGDCSIEDFGTLTQASAADREMKTAIETQCDVRCQDYDCSAVSCPIAVFREAARA